MLVSGGVLFLAVYTFFLVRPITVMFADRSEALVAACLVSACLVPFLGLLNNGFTERYTFWPALIGYALSLVMSASPRSRQAQLGDH